MQLLEVFLLPPLSIARLGGSDYPLENFSWSEDNSFHGGKKTVIVPDITLRKRDDFSLESYLPSSLTFRDKGKLRPTCPFVEVWVKLQLNSGEIVERPLNFATMKKLGIKLENIKYQIKAANCKISRRTLDPACSFKAYLEKSAIDFGHYELKAFSPVRPGDEPLVFKDKAISLGHIEIYRPADEIENGIDLSICRLRFIPAKGEVYGPPNAKYGQDVQTKKIYELVSEKNRILNQNASYMSYDADFDKYDNPDPFDTYEGAALDHYAKDPKDNLAWGVVDDTCDAIIEVQLNLGGEIFLGMTRVISGPPDYAPDRRPFISVADELADRDLDFVDVNKLSSDAALEEVLDIFQRAFETASLVNLDLIRTRAIQDNFGLWQENSLNSAFVPSRRERRETVNYSVLNEKKICSVNVDNLGNKLPSVGAESMSKKDIPYSDKSKDLISWSNDDSIESHDLFHCHLPYTSLVQLIHARLTDKVSLKSFLLTQKEHLFRMLRPPFGKFTELPENLDPTPNNRFRDIRNKRDVLHDMRMPPFMRDTGRVPLSLNRRQYQLVIDLLESLENENEK